MIISRRPVGDLTWARAKYESVRGEVESAWKIEDGKFRLSVSLPPQHHGYGFSARHTRRRRE